MNKTHEKIKKIKEENLRALLEDTAFILSQLEDFEEVGSYSQASINYITKRSRGKKATKAAE